MSISMNNHESRIKALENKISGSGNIIESKLANPGYAVYSNGLIINFGYNDADVTDRTTKFPKPFKTKCVSVITTPCRHDYNYIKSYDCALMRNENNGSTSATLTQFKTFNEHNTRCFWFAIGYLISNRIKSMLEVV